MKLCTSCNSEKELDNYQKDKHKPDGLYGTCRDCVSLKSRKYREDNKDNLKVRKKQSYIKNADTWKENWLKRRYGISLNDFNELLKHQNDTCGICKKEEIGFYGDKKKTLSVDHCHKTGKIRGLLCGKCNTALGLVDENPETLIEMIMYLKVA